MKTWYFLRDRQTGEKCDIYAVSLEEAKYRAFMELYSYSPEDWEEIF